MFQPFRNINMINKIYLHSWYVKKIIDKELNLITDLKL